MKAVGDTIIRNLLPKLNIGHHIEHIKPLENAEKKEK